MPPFSKELWEEGAQTKSFKLVNAGKFDEKGLIRILSEEPAQYPGCVGTRTLNDVSHFHHRPSINEKPGLKLLQNISDLHAQVASCHRGVSLINALVEEQSLEIIQYYMKAIMNTAEKAVRDLLRHVNKKFGGKPLEAVDYLDDGTVLMLKISIDEKDGSAIFDFTGTGSQVYVPHFSFWSK